MATAGKPAKPTAKKAAKKTAKKATKATAKAKATVASEQIDPLLAFLRRVPGLQDRFGSGRFDDGNWWVKFGIDITHPLAWHVVQELGCVLNYLSLEERLPTVFMPVSPPPYMNGGPEQFLSWVIESKDPAFSPADAAEWLEGRLPDPVDDPDEWIDGDEEDEDS